MVDMNIQRRLGINRRIIVCASLTAFSVLVASIALTLWEGHIMRQVVTDQFNAEQLAVARGAKYFVEREFNNLKRTIVSLTRQIAKTPLSSGMSPSIERLVIYAMESGIRTIEVINLESRKKRVYYSRGTSASEMPLKEGSLPDIPPGFLSENPLWTSPPEVKGSEIVITIAAPVPEQPSLIVLFHVNLSWLLDPYLKNIRSGKTGYAWIIDSEGTFLFHPNTSYIGENAFEVRQEVFPGPSYAAINMIQRDQMLRGMEGSGDYTSMWHRGITGEMRKLIAFTPIWISSYPPQLWSMAVVAPVHEIEGAIWKGLYWQLTFLGLFILVLGLAAASIIYLQMQWQRTLQEQVQARTAELKGSEEKYRSLVESAEDFIFTLDRQGCFLSVNSYTAKFFGSSADALIGQCIYGLFAPGLREQLTECVIHVFQHGTSIRDEFEMSNRFVQTWVAVNFMPLRDEAGGIKAALCIARDITENKKLLRQLISTEKLASLGTLAAGIAHEINNPIGVILGFCDLLLRKKEPGSQEYEDLKIIERQGLYCKDVTKNLLSFTRQDYSDKTHSDLNECLHDTIRIAQHTLEMNEIELTTEFGTGIPLVRGDYRQLQQVFLNLINNAVAAMHEGGRLEVRTHFDKESCKAIVQIEDEGSGIPQENLELIFEPFFTTKPEGEGTGLGLFVSYGIVNQNGGTIECESRTARAPGEKSGTTFTIKLVTGAGEES